MKRIILLLSFFISYSAFSQVNLTQGLRLYYPFSGNANDASGNGNNGTVNNATLTADRLGNPNSAYYFNGTNAFIQAATSASLSTGNKISICAWVRPHGFYAGTCANNMILIKGNQEYVPNNYFLRYSDIVTGCSASPNFNTEQFYGGSNNQGVVAPGYVNANQWYSVVWTYDGTVGKLYVNCVLQVSNTPSPLTFNNNDPLFIGRANFAGYPYWVNGDIDEVRVYDRAINSDEVSAYGACAASTCSGSLGQPIVNVTFGQGTNPGAPLATAVPGASTTYNYASPTGSPPANIIFDGDYSLVNGVPSNVAWLQGGDHTGNPNGYMAFFNAAPTPGEFYRQTITGLCPGTTYEFAAWILNAINQNILPSAVPPNVTFKIYNPADLVTPISSFNTGDVPAANTIIWRKYSTLFTTPVSLNSIVITLSNNNVGGTNLVGNDLAIDDITFRACGPFTQASFASSSLQSTLSVCENTAFTLYGTVGSGLNNPAYQWQISTDGGNNWTNIPAATALNLSSAGYAPGTYKFRITSMESANISSPFCKFLSNDIDLTVKPKVVSSISMSVCQGQSYAGYTTAGTYVDHFTAANGCDSARTLVLTVKPNATSNISQSICQGQSYSGYTTGGTYVDHFTAANGCDSARTLVLTVKPNATSTITQSICQGQSYAGYTSAGTYVDHFTSANGCDSARTLVLTIKPNATSNITQSICQGTSYLGYSVAGTYTDHFTATNGCDSARTLVLTIKPNATSNITATICQGQSYAGYTTSGVYTDHFTSANGCDSARTLTLTVTTSITTNISTSICQGGSYAGYTTGGTYIDHFTSAGGCDSARTLNLTVKPNSTSNIITSICQGTSYAGYTSSGTYVDHFTSANGCDSARTLVLTVKPNATSNITASICQGGTYLGYSASGTYTDHFTAANGCDSARTLVLTVKPNSTSNIITSICQGQSYAGYTTAGTYVDHFTGANGCDSARTLVLTVNPNVSSNIVTSICQGSSYAGYTTAGTYVDHFTSAVGCDSTRTLNLSIKPKAFSTNTQSICEGSSYEGHTTSGTYVSTFVAANGCDSVYTLNLTVKPKSITTNNQSICQGASYQGHTTTGTYVSTFTAANGCDSIYTLNLTVNNKSFVNDVKSICAGDVYQGHSTSGVYVSNLTNTAGCDSVYTLNLTVNPRPVIKVSKSNDLDCSHLSSRLSVTGASTYTWSPATGLNSTTSANPVASPNATTEYTVTGTDANGCSNTDMIKLIKNNTGSGDIYIPNTFSPNGDGKNECFRVMFKGDIQQFKMLIYNRWGEKIFESNDANSCWNGTYLGKPALEASYVYYITAKTSCGNFEQKGNILLIR